MSRTSLLTHPATALRPGAGEAFRAWADRVVTALPAILLFLLDSPALVLGYHVASRLAYVLYVGRSLRRRAGAERRPTAVREHDFASFRRIASSLMENDALSFVALLLVSQPRLAPEIPAGWTRVVAVALVALGAGTKFWAARVLGAAAYYWHDFFSPPLFPRAQRTGPYRWLQNPMYTVGYAHAYGAALFAFSGLGLLAAAFDQTAILTFHWLVERPHVRALYKQ